jgi:hypothetical protein
VPSPGLLSLVLSGAGEVGRLWPRFDGSGVPDSLGGRRNKTPVGINIMSSRNPGVVAKIVTDKSRGTTRSRYSIKRLIVRFGGKRVRKAE